MWKPGRWVGASLRMPRRRFSLPLLRFSLHAGVAAQDFDRAHVTVGEAVGLMHDAPSAAVLIERITRQAEALLR